MNECITFHIESPYWIAHELIVLSPRVAINCSFSKTPLYRGGSWNAKANIKIILVAVDANFCT